MLHPGKLTWNLEITPLKREIIFQTSMIVFQPLIFQGVVLLNCVDARVKEDFLEKLGCLEVPDSAKYRPGHLNRFIKTPFWPPGYSRQKKKRTSAEPLLKNVLREKKLWGEW